MPALVRYAGSIAPYAPYSKRMRIAYGAARYGYRNRHKIYGAARKIYRAYRAYKARTRQVGFRPNQGTTKRWVASDLNAQSRSSKTLYATDVTAIPAEDNSGVDLNQRMRNLANVRGFKLCIEVRNVATASNSYPMYFNFAVIAPKESASLADIGTRFFRSSSNENRSVDFTNTTMDGLEYHCRPINKDRWTILKHKRFRIGPFDQSNVLATGTNGYMTYNCWVPLKRQVRFISGQTEPEEGKVFVVYWASRMFEPTGDANQISPMFEITERYVTYFRDPK